MAKQETPTHFDDLPASAQVPARTLANLLDISEVTVWRWSKIGKRPRPRKLGSNTIETKHFMTTVEARRELDILMPAARVFELRAMGHDIATVWTLGVTEYGRKHRIAQYVFSKPRHERHSLELYARLSRLGISMCIVLSQLWGLYRYLSRLAGA